MSTALRVFVYLLIVGSVFYVTYPNQVNPRMHENRNQPTAASQTAGSLSQAPATVEPVLRLEPNRRGDDGRLVDDVFDRPVADDVSEQPTRIARSLSEFIQQAVDSDTPLSIDGLEFTNETEAFDFSLYFENE